MAAIWNLEDAEAKEKCRYVATLEGAGFYSALVFANTFFKATCAFDKVSLK